MAFISAPAVLQTISFPRPHFHPTHSVAPPRAFARRRLRPRRPVALLEAPVAGAAGPVALLLVDHGSRRAAANDMLEEVAQLVRARLPGGDAAISVATAHMEMARPTIDEAFRACVRAGARHVVVVPFFLAPGKHATTDIPNMVHEAASAFPAVSFEVRPHIGPHPALVDIILERAQLAGELTR